MKVLRFLLPLLVIASAALIAAYLIHSKPTPAKRPTNALVTTINATRLHPTNYPTTIPSQGTVSPRTESTLIPEVSGRILSISPNFRPGGFFEQEDVLVTIDPADYETAVVVAQATLAGMEAALETEKARSQQALENWDQLGNGQPPSPLVLRQPQLAEATAAVASAQARLTQAKRDLQRTRISAPYAGRILEKQVDVGQVVSPGSVLASIFAVDYAEVRLPVSNDQLPFINVPERFRGDPTTEAPLGPKVTLHEQIGAEQIQWHGHIIRAGGAVDTLSRQLFLTAQINDPYARTDANTPPLKIGSFVRARITGKVLTNVFVIPRSAVRQGNEILLVKDNTLSRRLIEPLWTDEKNIVVRHGLQPDDVLCLTQVPYAADGAPVSASIDGAPPENSRQPGAPAPDKKAPPASSAENSPGGDTQP